MLIVRRCCACGKDFDDLSFRGDSRICPVCEEKMDRKRENLFFNGEETLLKEKRRKKMEREKKDRFYSLAFSTGTLTGALIDEITDEDAFEFASEDEQRIPLEALRDYQQPLMYCFDCCTAFSLSEDEGCPACGNSLVIFENGSELYDVLADDTSYDYREIILPEGRNNGVLFIVDGSDNLDD